MYSYTKDLNLKNAKKFKFYIRGKKNFFLLFLYIKKKPIQ
jgi:hypothetical protein